VSLDENEISYKNIIQVLLTAMLVVSFSALLCSKCSTLLTQASEKVLSMFVLFSWMAGLRTDVATPSVPPLPA
jgi:hypothetical protein